MLAHGDVRGFFLCLIKGQSNARFRWPSFGQREKIDIVVILIRMLRRVLRLFRYSRATIEDLSI